MGNETKLDAASSAFFQRELEYIKKKSYDTKYKPLKYAKLIPVSTEAPAGAQQITFQKYTKYGIAKIIGSGVHDLPDVGIIGEESTIKVKSIGAKYSYNINEIRASQMAGKNLEMRKAEAARRAIEQKKNSIAWNGDSTYNMSGLIDYSGITEYTVPNDGTGSTKTWSTKTPDQIVRDMGGLLNSIMVATNGVAMMEREYILLLPITQYDYIMDTRMTGNSDKTIMSYFLENNRYVAEIDSIPELEDAGASTTDRMMCYRRDPDVLTFECPIIYEQLPAQEKGLSFEIPVHSRAGGVIVYYPLEVAYGDGI